MNAKLYFSKGKHLKSEKVIRRNTYSIVSIEKLQITHASIGFYKDI
ncbi:MAG TPA: hypothetical protein PK281_00435 [Flavobacteriales bacterium]|nr:hypothetical protein [Flavobacteriales bacterium]